MEYLEDRNPFSEDKTLHNIATGMTASEKVNVDTAKQVGQQIVYGMVGNEISQYSFKRKDQVVTMATNKVQIGNEIVTIDPQL